MVERMNDLLITALISFSASMHSALHVGPAKPAPSAEKVLVLEAVPADRTFQWEVQPSHVVHCSGSQCDAYYMPSAESVQEGDTVLRLLMPDAKVLIVECNAKEVPVVGEALKFYWGSDANVPKRRGCRAPLPGASTPAVTEGSHLKLFFSYTPEGGAAMTISENYTIRGYLIPVAEQKAGSITSRSYFVSSIPSGSTVYVDSQPAGSTPATISLPGDGLAHEISVKKSGFVAVDTTVLPENNERRLSFSLKPLD